MAGLVRKQVYIRPSQEQFLKHRAAETGVTEADLIRRAIDLLARAPAEAAFDSQAWADESAFIRQRAQVVPESQTPWRFRREDAYEERLAKLTHTG